VTPVGPSESTHPICVTRTRLLFPEHEQRFRHTSFYNLLARAYFALSYSNHLRGLLRDSQIQAPAHRGACGGEILPQLWPATCATAKGDCEWGGCRRGGNIGPCRERAGKPRRDQVGPAATQRGIGRSRSCPRGLTRGLINADWDRRPALGENLQPE